MPYTRDIGREFWFQFDNSFLFSPSAAAVTALEVAYTFDGTFNLDRPVDLFRASHGGTGHPAPFLTGIQPNRAGMIDLARLQVAIFDAHLATEDDVRNAFEDFAQGVLLDTRRLPGLQTHKMDGTPEDWVGYHRWNAFARAIALLGEDVSRWQFLDHCIGLAWAIQTEARPVDDIANPGLSAARLTALRDRWMKLSTKTLDWAFAANRFRAPTIAEIDTFEGVTPTLTGYARVQQILETATPSGNPMHRQSGVALGRFWLKPYAEFITLSVYNRQLIADPGPSRGADSALVKVLRGTLTGVPRMPRAPLPPVPDPEIQFISDWIDAGMPPA